MAVAPENVNNSVPYLERTEYMRNHLGLTIKTVGADIACGTNLTCQALDDMGSGLYTRGTTGGVNYTAEITQQKSHRKILYIREKQIVLFVLAGSVFCGRVN